MSGGQPAPAGVAAIPSQVPLPNEGERSTSPELTDWTTDLAEGQQWLLDPCRPTDYPTDARRTEFRTVSRSGPELFQARQLAVYADAARAEETVTGFRRALAACATGGTAAQGGAWQWTTADVELGDDGLVAASTRGGPGYAPEGERIAITRVGSAVFLAFDQGEYGAAELDGGVDQVQDVAREFVATW